MPTSERAIVLHHLQLGRQPLAKEVRDLLDSVQAGPPAEIIVAGGVLGGGEAAGLADEGLGALGRAARGGLTLLLGEGDEALGEATAQGRLREQLGRVELSFGEELRPGMGGRRLAAEDGVLWVTLAAGLDPARGRPFEELIAWPQLRSFLRAFARQLEMKRTLAPPSDPQQLAAQALARAVFEGAPGKEEKALTELLRHLEGREPGRYDEGADELAQSLLRRGALLLREQLLARVRYEVDDAAAVVVLGAASAHEGDEDAPSVVLTGAASGEHPTWVEVGLGAALRVQLRGLRTLVPPLKPQAPKAPAPEAAPVTPGAAPVTPSAAPVTPSAAPPAAPLEAQPPAATPPAAQEPAAPAPIEPVAPAANDDAPAAQGPSATAPEAAQGAAPAAAKDPGGKGKGKKKKGD